MMEIKVVKEEQHFNGYLVKLMKHTYKQLRVMMYALSELSSISESLQKQTVTLQTNSSTKQETYLNFTKRKGVYNGEVQIYIEANLFKGVPLKVFEDRKRQWK